MNINFICCLEGATLVHGDEKLLFMSKNNRLLTYALGADVDDKDGAIVSTRTGRRSSESEASVGDEDVNPEDDKELSALVSAPPTCHDLYRGGYHHDGLIAMDIAVEKPLLVTIGTDRCLRAWDFETMACKFVYNFRTDEPLAVAIHPSSFQVKKLCLFAYLVDLTGASFWHLMFICQLLAKPHPVCLGRSCLYS